MYIFHLLVVGGQLLNLCRHGGRDPRLAETRHALESAGGVERHDAREDGRGDALGANVVHPVLTRRGKKINSHTHTDREQHPPA